MILGFKRRFVPFVQDGSKTHSIREDKKRRWKVGATVDAFTDVRQKSMKRIIPKTLCTRVQEIVIVPTERQSMPLKVMIDGDTLSPDEADLLFFRDGFRDKTGETYQHMQQAREFWEGRLPFVGRMIHWHFPKPSRTTPGRTLES